VRRLAVSLYVLVVYMALPAMAFAQGGPAQSSAGGDAPTGHDGTITSVFIVAAGIPAVLALLTLIDVARGKHTERHSDH
jgi:hypothetical protein